MLTLVEYQKKALETNKFRNEGDLFPPLLGVFGETGSLLTGAKKCFREKCADTESRETVIEELGDVLWYLTVMLNTAGLSITEVISAEPKVAELSDRNAGTFLAVDALWDSDLEALEGTGYGAEYILVALACAVGRLVVSFHEQKFHGGAQVSIDDFLGVFVALSRLAFTSEIPMQQVAESNLDKIFDRWPIKRAYQEPFDLDFEVDERFPDRLVIDIFEKSVGGKVYVFQKSGDLFLGDRLTDNVIVEDDYRFHDVFHFANAAVLSWSPVLRSLLKRKRKSSPKIDETEDGARAIITEEGLVAWIFAQASRADYFVDIERGELSFELLKQVRKLACNYEVSDCSLWQWEEAILQGYEAFRYLQENKKARITVDTIKHRLEYEAMP